MPLEIFIVSEGFAGNDYRKKCLSWVNMATLSDGCDDTGRPLRRLIDEGRKMQAARRLKLHCIFLYYKAVKLNR